MADFVLHPHPDFPSTAVHSITASAKRRPDARLDLEFRLSGAIDVVAWPARKRVEVADRLWEHSCLEAFVGDDGRGYRELNFTTSGQWAAYCFDEYRAGMQASGGVLLAGGRTTGDGRLVLRRSFRLSDMAEAQAWRVGLSAIIEAVDGTKSYWALAHPPGRPDFHDPDCFTATLPPPEAA